MHKKAVIFDFDNTIYSAPSIGEVVFAPLFQLIQKSGAYHGTFEEVKHDLLRKPFQVVAAKYRFGATLLEQGIQLLQHTTYEGPIEAFPDYEITKTLPLEKYLVTTGFVKLQESKINSMKLEEDFAEIHIVDPLTSANTKKDVFADILKRKNLQPSDVLVIGDDPHSEIQAAIELGIDAVLYDKFNLHPDLTSLPKINDFRQLEQYL